MKDKIFCITGKLESFNQRKDAFYEIEMRGGLTQAKLNNSCDYLVIGNKGNKNWQTPLAGTKIIHARKAGIPIITENELNNMLEDSPFAEAAAIPKAVRVERSAKSKIVKKVYDNWTTESNVNLDNLPTDSFVLRLTYSVRGLESDIKEIHHHLEQFNNQHLEFLVSSLIGFNTLSIDTEPAEVYTGLFKVIEFKQPPADLKERLQALFDFIENQDHANYRKLWIRIYKKPSAYYERWSNKLEEAKQQKNH